MSATWIAVLGTSGGCYLLKLAGLTVPQRVLANPRVRRFAELVPVALLAHYASGGELPWLASQTFLRPFPGALGLRHSV